MAYCTVWGIVTGKICPYIFSADSRIFFFVCWYICLFTTLCVWVFTSMYVCAHVCGAYGGQSRALHPLGVRLQVVLCQLGSCESNQCS